MKEQVLSKLLEWCPDLFKPMAEMWLPSALEELSDEEMVSLNDAISQSEDKDELVKASLLFEWVQKRDPSLKDVDIMNFDPMELIGRIGP